MVVCVGPSRARGSSGKECGASVEPWDACPNALFQESFTLSPQLNESVNEAFCRLHADGLIYRGTYMVNWSPSLQTAVSDLEARPPDPRLTPNPNPSHARLPPAGVPGWRACSHAQLGCPTRGAPSAAARQLH